MATYPSIGMRFDIRPETKHRNDISEAGTVRSVDLNNATVYKIDITHPLIDSTDRDTLTAFYTAYKSTLNDITLDGVIYDVLFQEDYAISNVGADWYTLETVLMGTKQ